MKHILPSPAQEKFRRYAEWIISNRIAVVAITILITAFALLQAQKIKLVIDMNATMPQSHPYISTTNEIEAVFGSKYVVVIGITPRSGDIYQQEVINKVIRITTALAKAPGIVSDNLLSVSARRAKSISGAAEGIEVKPLIDADNSTPAQLNALKKALAQNPTFADTIISTDGRTAAVIAEFKEPPEGFRSILERVEVIVSSERDAKTEINIGGLPRYLAAVEDYSERMVVLLPIAIIVLSLVLFAGFRTKQGLALPLVTAFTAVIWGVGAMGAFGIPMDVFNATTPILILAVATGHAVQILKRYYEEYEHCRSGGTCSPMEANNTAIVRSLMYVGPVMISAGVVASFGFFSLVVFEISTVRTFGIFTGIGILAALILEMTFIPAVRSLLSPPAERGDRNIVKSSVWHRASEYVGVLVTGPQRRSVYFVFLVLGFAAIAGMPRINVDNSVKSFLSEGSPVSIEDRLLNERLGGTNTVYVLVEGRNADAIKNPKTLQAMDNLESYLQTRPYVGKTVSIAYFVKRMNQAMHGDAPSYFTIPDDAALVSQYLLLYSLSGEPEDFNSYVDYDYQKAKLTIYLKTDSSAYVEKLIKEINTFSRANFGNDIAVRVGGSVPQSAALSEVMVRGKLLNILQIAAAVFLISAILFRSFVGGLLVLLPLLVAVVANFGLMGWSGILLNVPTSLTAAMAVGIGADYAIYLIYRLREELAKGVDDKAAVRRVIETAGQAILFVAIAVAAGYSVLLLSFGFKVHQWLAILIGTAMIISALSALFLIPALLLTFRPSFIFQEGRMLQSHKFSSATAAFVVVCIIFGQPEEAIAAEIDVGSIMAKNFSISRVKDSVFEATFTLTSKGGSERVRKTSGMTKLQANGLDQMRMTRFTSPPDVKGMSTLVIENGEDQDNLWIYLPAMKKVRRLVSNNKKDSFLGTDFSYADVIGYVPSDWNYTLLNEEVINGESCYVVSGIPKNEIVKSESGYSKRIDWIRKDNFATVKSEFWDEAGQFLKLATYSDIRLVDSERGRWYAMRLESSNAQTGHRTIIQIDSLKVNQDVDEQIFSARYLEK